MKKNILKVAFVAAIALVSGINVFNFQKTENLSDVALANVEALANMEGMDCHYVNGVTNIQLEPNIWHSTKKRYYDCCAVQVDGYHYKDECR